MTNDEGAITHGLVELKGGACPVFRLRRVGTNKEYAFDDVSEKATTAGRQGAKEAGRNSEALGVLASWQSSLSVPAPPGWEEEDEDGEDDSVHSRS